MLFWNAFPGFVLNKHPWTSIITRKWAIDYFFFLKLCQTIPFEFLYHLNRGWRFLLWREKVDRHQSRPTGDVINDDTDLYCRANAASIIASASSQQVVVAT